MTRPPTPDRILEASINAIESGGEASLRIDSIAKISGITIPSIYHFFNNREGLVAAAQAERFRRATRTDRAKAIDLVASAQSFDDFMAGISGFIASTGLPDSMERQRVRTDVLGSAAARPELERELRRTFLLAAEDLSPFAEVAIGRNFLTTGFDPDSYHVWWLATIAGRHLVDLFDDPRISVQWEQMTELQTRAVFRGFADDPGVVGGRGAPASPSTAVRSSPTETEPKVPPEGTRAKLLEAAIRAINRNGEAGLRVGEIANEAEVTKPSLYHFFGDREGLIAEAQAERWRRLILQGLDEAVAFMRNVKSVDEYIEGIPSMVALGAGPVGAERRRARSDVLGSAISRPRLTDEIRKNLQIAIDQFSEFFVIGRERGIVTTDLDIDAYAIWWFAILTGRRLIDVIDDERITRQWTRMTELSIRAVVCPITNRSID